MTDELNNTTKNYKILVEKLNILIDWQITSFDNIVNKTLMNKLTNDICLHCICGHRVGKLNEIPSNEPIIKKEDDDTIMSKTADKVYDEHKKEIDNIAKNSTTTIFNECSLVPLIKDNSDYYILVGKKCAKHFNISDSDIKTSFKSKIKKKQEQKKKQTQIKKKMSLDPKILLQNYEFIDRGKYKGMSIYTINTLTGGSYYLEFITTWNNISPETINSIEDLLFLNL
jgi:hypothetical protein